MLHEERSLLTVLETKWWKHSVSARPLRKHLLQKNTLENTFNDTTGPALV